MSTFNDITSITSLDDINDYNISENKHYIILFFYWNKCGACHSAIPIVCEVYEKHLPKNYNCKIIKVHTNDIKDDNLRNLYEGGVPAFRILKKNGNKYDLYHLKNDKYMYSTDGFSAENYNNNYLSTKNTLIDWINTLNKSSIKENYNNLNNVYELKSSKLESMRNKIYVEKDSDDGSGYSIMQLYDPYVKELSKSFNKIINDKLKILNKKY